MTLCRTRAKSIRLLQAVLEKIDQAGIAMRPNDLQVLDCAVLGFTRIDKYVPEPD